jgi:hypothetical protein
MEIISTKDKARKKTFKQEQVGTACLLAAGPGPMVMARAQLSRRDEHTA